MKVRVDRGVYRMPKSMIEFRFSPPDATQDEVKPPGNPFDELPGAPEEYEITEPDEELDAQVLFDLDDEPGDALELPSCSAVNEGNTFSDADVELVPLEGEERDV